jgi:uncharacterized RDD family membrane protein YckC
MAKLLVQESAGVREFELVDNEVHIGRELDNTLRVADPSVSRHHCVLRRTPGGFEIQDLQSSNGVLLNGSRVQTALLRDGDKLTLGQIQINFIDPAPPLAATMMVPAGTVRMSPDQVAAVQGTGSLPPAPVPVAPVIPVAPPAPVAPVAPVAPPPPPPPTPAPAPLPQIQLAPVPPPAPPAPVYVAPPPPAAQAHTAPYAPPPKPKPFGEFTNPGVGGTPQQAAGFLGKFLPPIPDDAQPTGERGDFLTRFIAVLIDGAVLIPVVIIMMVLSVVLGMVARMVPALGCLGSIVIMILYLVAVFGYQFYFMPSCIAKHGATIGKKIMKLRVVPEDNPYGRLTFSQALIRQICHLLNFGIGYFLALGGERKAVHDMITKTVVIKVDR